MNLPILIIMFTNVTVMVGARYSLVEAFGPARPAGCCRATAGLRWQPRDATYTPAVGWMHCEYMYIHTHVYTHMYIHMCTYILCICICVCMCICIFLYLRIYIYVYVGRGF